MAEFYVETLRQENGDFLVHKSTCSALPTSKDKIKYLGSISNINSAVKKAGEHHVPAKSCSLCGGSSASA